MTGPLRWLRRRRARVEVARKLAALVAGEVGRLLPSFPEILYVAPLTDREADRATVVGWVCEAGNPRANA